MKEIMKERLNECREKIKAILDEYNADISPLYDEGVSCIITITDEYSGTIYEAEI